LRTDNDRRRLPGLIPPGLARLARTWLPTALGSSMLVLEIPVAAAAVARTSTGAEALAAFGVCIAILVVANSPALAITPLVVSDADHEPNRRTMWYAVVVGAVTAAALAVLVTVPPLFALLRTGLALPDGIAEQVPPCLLALAPASIAVAVRRYLHGRLITAQRTGGIAAATVTRLVLSAAIAWTLVLSAPGLGAAVGGIALCAGAAAEATTLAVAVRRLRQSFVAAVLGLSDLVRRHGSLAATRVLNMAPQLVTTIGVTHSALPAASLVVWPGLYGLLSLFTGPTSDLESVVASHVKRTGDSRSPAALTAVLTLVFVGLYLAVVLSPAGSAYLHDFVGTPLDATALGLDWAALALAVPGLWVLRSQLRGLVIAQGRTSLLVLCVVTHSIVLVGVAAALALGPLPGIANACLAITAGLLAESVAIAVCLRRVAVEDGLSSPVRTVAGRERGALP